MILWLWCKGNAIRQIEIYPEQSYHLRKITGINNYIVSVSGLYFIKHKLNVLNS